MHMEQESEEENQEQYPKIMEQTYSREGKKIQLKWLFLVCLFYKPFKKHFFLVVCKFSLQIKSFKPDSFSSWNLDYTPKEEDTPSLSEIKARFLQLMIDLNLGDRQADAISR